MLLGDLTITYVSSMILSLATASKLTGLNIWHTSYLHLVPGHGFTLEYVEC